MVEKSPKLYFPITKDLTHNTTQEPLLFRQYIKLYDYSSGSRGMRQKFARKEKNATLTYQTAILPKTCQQ